VTLHQSALAAPVRGVAAGPLRQWPGLLRSPAMISRAMSRILLCDATVAFEMADEPFEFCWQAEEQPITPGCVLRVGLGVHRAWLVIEDIGVVEPLQGQTLALLPPVVRALLVAQTLAPVFARLESMAGARFALFDADPSWRVPSGLPRLHFSVRHQRTRVSSMGFVQPETPAAWQALAELWVASAIPTSRDMAHWRVPVRFEIGRTLLPLAQLRRVEIGDVLRIDNGPGAGAPAVLRLRAGTGPAPEITGRFDEGRITITQVGAPTMNADDPIEPVAQDETPQDFDALTLTVSFDLGRRTMTLGELRAVRPGAVFELEQSLERSTVRVVVNGELFARGQLVALGEMLGVRVSELAGSS
jgi:type III secretion protein Q